MSVQTHKYGGLTQAIVTECIVFVDNSKDLSNVPHYHTLKAMWDTGAINTVLSPKVIKALVKKLHK